MQKYPFHIDTNILNLVAEISERAGQIRVSSNLNNSPQLRRSNRIKTVYSSLAIEQNTLTLDQVTAVLQGKRVLAPPKDIEEVRNAFEIYEHLEELDPYSIEDLLFAHGIMMKNIGEDAGEFRSKPVGVVDSGGRILHFGTLPEFVPGLVDELLHWVKEEDLHVLIKGCVFHYEFELIHPFSDGNGRIGRLWHTLLLSKWNPLFAWLPIESIIHDRQEEYYRAINQSNHAADSTAFITFMLSAILAALQEAAVDLPQTKQKKTADREETIEAFLERNNRISNGDVRELFGVSPATANRILNALVKQGRILRFRNGKFWAYRKP